MEVRDTVRVGGLEVDRAPVTNARYKAFVEASGHRPPAYWEGGTCPESLLQHPVIGVDFFDALAFARWAGGVLPTEEEWLSAAGLEGAKAYPWGDAFDAEMCNTLRADLKGTTPVGRFPPAPSGCVDLCGNVWEMTCTAYPDDDQAIVVKGGSWYDYPVHAKLETRFSARVQKTGNTVGFRLVYGRPLRLPDFLDDGIVQRCIEWRRAGAERRLELDVEPGEGDGEEYEDVLAELREEAEPAISALEEDSPDVDTEAVGEALELFDALDESPDELFDEWELKANQDEETAPTVWERMQTLVTAYPRSFLAGALGMALLLLVVALPTGDDGARGARTRLAMHEEAGDGHGRTRVPDGGMRAESAGEETRHATRLERALGAIREGTGPQREEAERVLIENGRREDVVRAMEDTTLPAAGRASLRYVMTTLTEKDRRNPRPPTLTSAPPRDGLVVFFRRMDASVAEEIAKVRRTARAEGLDTTVIYTGTTHANDLIRAYRRVFRDIRLYIDANGTLQRLWGAERSPTVAGVSGGGLRFVHRGPIQRSKLAAEVAALER